MSAAVAVLSIGALGSTPLSAQQCLGLRERTEFAISASVLGERFADGVALDATGLLVGPAFLQARAVSTRFRLSADASKKETMLTPAVNLALQFPSAAASVCLLVGYAYGHILQGSDLDRPGARERSRTIPLGLGIGRTLWHGRDLSFTPYTQASMLVVRYGGDGPIERAGTENRYQIHQVREVAGVVGVSLGFRAVAISASITASTIDQSSPMFAASISIQR